ncbi:hypothetical protein BDZ97DRAFT_1810547 [Flammula alnicola]|nr:hypothetical protein BDZ97DRAFT_1810547 [Flammula alnicola]
MPMSLSRITRSFKIFKVIFTSTTVILTVLHARACCWGTHRQSTPSHFHQMASVSSQARGMTRSASGMQRPAKR